MNEHNNSNNHNNNNNNNQEFAKILFENSSTDISQNDILGTIEYQSNDGNDLNTVAKIKATATNIQALFPFEFILDIITIKKAITTPTHNPIK